MRQTRRGKRALLRREPLCRRGKVRQHEPREHAKQDRRNSLNQKEPLPRFERLDVFHLQDAVCEEAAKGAGEGRGAVKERDAQALLAALVPKGEVKDDAGEEAGFGNAEEEADEEEVVVLGDDHHAAGADAPGDHNASDPSANSLSVGVK